MFLICAFSVQGIGTSTFSHTKIHISPLDVLFPCNACPLIG
uniref:Uncharacterized protein n=1 Tax=Arundo donax TaxID=35708 RepID=A0A0A9B6A4_ARUDO